VHRGCGRQHEAEQLCRDDAKAGTVEVQTADCIVLPQLLHRNPAYRPTRCAGHSCEQQRVWRLTLALDAAAQDHTAEGGIVVVVIIIVVIVVIIVHLSLQIRLSNRLQLDREAITAKPRQVGHLTRRSEPANVLELLDVYLDV
tara:strand:- start:203 stop:631 length:429 start_codon:yes stop_codon:yes gene_type:complete